MHKGGWWATVHRVPKNQARLKVLSMHAYAIWELPNESTPTGSLYAKITGLRLRIWKGVRSGCAGDTKRGQRADRGRQSTINVKLDTRSPLSSQQLVS